MADQVTFALAQINPTVGDLAGNFAKLVEYCGRARDEHAADVVVFPELAICGYPPEDLLLRQDFLADCADYLARLANRVDDDLVVLVGHPLAENGKVFNALSTLRGGEIIATYRKQCLPNYAVFDEARYFSPGCESQLVTVKGRRIGLLICEDLWEDAPLKNALAAGAEVVVAVNASPFHRAQVALRERQVVAKNARHHNVPIIYLNQVGGQDELVFDGGSLAVQGDGEVAARLPPFRESLQAVTLRQRRFLAPPPTPPLPETELAYEAIVLGVRDYIEKNGFAGAVLGLSGGIDSALCLAIATDAIGAERVLAVMMRSRYTSKMSLQDARAQSKILGNRYEEISIEDMFDTALTELTPLFAGRAADTSEENIQSRCRGLLLMAISNKLGLLVLTTGNKSEMAVGYATLYGDMVGGFAAIKDVPKMLVYELARLRNDRARTRGQTPPIPERVLTRAPSAELAPNQTDQDSLPAYETLDPILEAFVERDQSAAQIIAAGYAPDTVHQVLRLVAANEYKRRQAAPGVRITARAFGKDRRYPITCGFTP